MNPTHLHLVITHLPIFGSILGAVVLGYGLWTKSNQTNIAAYIVLIISAIGAGIAYLTGESAEETVEKISGISENTVNAHEDFALFALVSLVVLGLASIIGVWFTLRRTTLAGFFGTLVLLISLISFILVAWTGYLGGQIRHTEISSGTAAPAGQRENDDD